MVTAFKEDNLHIGDFIKADFTQYHSDKRYDLVTSFGFVEHFEDYKDIIERHCSLVDNGGYLLITAPNYAKGLRHKLAKTYNPGKFKTHNIDSMNPKIWENICIKNGFKIVYCGYIGIPCLTKHGNKTKANRVLYMLMCVILRLFRSIPLLFKSKSGNFSSDIAIVAKKL
jgi:hypothetical protein